MQTCTLMSTLKNKMYQVTYLIFIKYEYHSKSLPVSQLSPPKPTGQVHSYPLMRSVQVAPFRHGLLAHSKISVKEISQIII